MPAIEPVVSKKSGHIFEKRLIIKHIEVAGRCPITKHELSKDDLIEVKSDNTSTNLERPRSVLGTSMPGMFTELQSQWEKILLETSGLKKELEVSRQELAHSLYQYDASTRVISNLIKERDMAREELANYQNEFGNFDEEADMMGDEYNNMGISKELISRISEMTYKLITERKSRKITDDLYTISQIENFTCKNTFRPFADVKSNLIVNNPIGINCFDVNNSNHFNSYRNQYLVTGSNDGNISFSQISELNLIDTKILKIHNRKINEIKFYPSNDILGFASCSDDNTAAFMIKSAQSENFEERYRIKNIHADIITSVSFHPLEEYALFSSYDGYWSFHNLLKVCF
jgi:pre-mRNA-processing factor 19